MAFLGVLRLIMRTGRIAEPAPLPPAAAPGLPNALAGSAQVRHVDVGSCNGCEIEIGSAFGPVYDAQRYGANLVASPRHADVLMVTGPVTHNMAEPFRRTISATPRPRLVVAVGDCARNCGPFAQAYGVAGAVADFTPVDLEVAGCPPEPSEIVSALRRITRR